MEKVRNISKKRMANLPSPSSLVKPKSNDSTIKLFRWLRVLGIILPKKYKLAYIIYSIVFNMFAIILLPLAFTLSYFIGEKMALGHFLTSLQVCINAYACSIKFVIIAFLRKYIFSMAPILEKLDARVKYPEEMREIQWVIKFGYRTVMWFVFIYFSYSTCTCLGAIYMGRPPYSLFIPFFNWRDSKQSLFIVSILELCLINIACYQDVANDSYAIIYVKLIHIHIKLLVTRVLRIGVDDSNSQEQNRKELILCIRDHKNIIELMKTISPVISATVFVQFVVSAAVLSTTLINLFIFGERSTVLGSFLFVGSLLSEIFPICYFVNCLTLEGESLPMAIFHMNWVDQDLEFRRLCLFFMHRSQQPLIFFAGKMFPITLNSFVSIVKFSFSLYTLISNMDFGERFK